MILRMTAVVSACLLALTAVAAEQPASEQFRQLLDEHWQRAEQEQVFFRTDPDAYRPNVVGARFEL